MPLPKLPDPLRCCDEKDPSRSNSTGERVLLYGSNHCPGDYKIYY